MINAAINIVNSAMSTTNEGLLVIYVHWEATMSKAGILPVCLLTELHPSPATLHLSAAQVTYPQLHCDGMSLAKSLIK